MLRGARLAVDWVRLYKCSKRKDGKEFERVEGKRGKMWAKVESVYDGDTFTALIVHDGSVCRRRCRCSGYDSPEMRGPNADKPRAEAAKKELETVLPASPFLMQYTGFDKYGRLLVSFDVGGKSLCQHMVDEGHGYLYDGGKKRTQKEAEGG